MYGSRRNIERSINGSLQMLHLLLIYYLLLSISTLVANKNDNIFYCRCGTKSLIQNTKSLLQKMNQMYMCLLHHLSTVSSWFKWLKYFSQRVHYRFMCPYFTFLTLLTYWQGRDFGSYPGNQRRVWQGFICSSSQSRRKR